MPKHVIEEQLLHKAGFNAVSIGEVLIASENADQKLIMKTDGTIDITVENNNVLKFKTTVPVFTTSQW